jgi:AraC-like DNA-binding protein
MYQRLLPPPLLKEYVTYFWCGEIELGAAKVYTHYAAACSKAQLLFHYAGDFQFKSASGHVQHTFRVGIYGPKGLYNQYWTNSKQAGIFGIQFYPHALARLFSIPAIELTNQGVELQLLLGNQGVELIEKVNACHSFEQKVKTVSNFLVSRIATHRSNYKNIEWAIRQMHLQHGQLVLSELVNLCCLSQRQFERRFKQLSGFSPQSYLKLIRFETALQRISDVEKNFTQLAVDAGYYDQAHFNRDFKQFTGVSPSQYIAVGDHL